MADDSSGVSFAEAETILRKNFNFRNSDAALHGAIAYRIAENGPALVIRHENGKTLVKTTGVVSDQSSSSGPSEQREIKTAQDLFECIALFKGDIRRPSAIPSPAHVKEVMPATRCHH